MSKVGESIKKYREIFLVPAASNMPQINDGDGTVTHVFTIPDGYTQREGKIAIKQKRGAHSPDVLYDVLRRRLIVKSTLDSGDVQDINVDGKQVVVVSNVDLERLIVAGSGKAIMKSSSLQSAIEFEAGKIKEKTKKRNNCL